MASREEAVPFKETTIVDWREQMALTVIRGTMSVSEAALVFGVSRPTVRQWRDRYLEQGRAGLVDRSHAPQRRIDSFSYRPTRSGQIRTLRSTSRLAG